ncbi:MAG: hypothetical protein IJW90_02325 [Clostridia bacterium]|nr:hypothetical protein [Clostridia bacterium]
MTYANHQILALVSHMTDMSEDLISESDIRAGASMSSKTTRRGRFATFMNHPAMVAVLCAVVSLGVLVAVVLAGRQGPVTPPVGGTQDTLPLESEAPMTEDVTQESPDSEYSPADFSGYDSIVHMYGKVVETIPDVFAAPGWDYSLVFNHLFAFPDEQTRDTYTRMCNAILELYPGGNVNLHTFFGYVIKDINGDGVEELCLLTKEFTIVALFTKHNGKPVLLEEFWNRKRGFVNENGRIIIVGSSGADMSSREVHRIDTATGRLVFEEAIGLDGHTEDLQAIYYHQIGDKKTYISEAEYSALQNQAPYMGIGAEKSREILGAEYTPVSMPSEVSVFFRGGSYGPGAKSIRIYTDPEKIYAYADFFTDVLVRSDLTKVPQQALIGGGTYWIIMKYEIGETVIYADWGGYFEYDDQWYQLEDKHHRVIDELFERYGSDVELSEVNIHVLAKDDGGFCGVMEDTEQYVYVKGFSGTWFEMDDTVRIVYETEKLKESEGAVVGSEGETVAYQWIIEDPLSGWVIWRSE